MPFISITSDSDSFSTRDQFIKKFEAGNEKMGKL